MAIMGMSDGKLDGEVVVYGKNVAIEKFEVEHELTDKSGIIIPKGYGRGFNLVKGRVISIGADAVKATNLKVGDIVLCDHFGAFADTHPIAVYPYDNVIGKCLD